MRKRANAASGARAAAAHRSLPSLGEPALALREPLEMGERDAREHQEDDREGRRGSRPRRRSGSNPRAAGPSSTCRIASTPSPSGISAGHERAERAERAQREVEPGEEVDRLLERVADVPGLAAPQQEQRREASCRARRARPCVTTNTSSNAPDVERRHPHAEHAEADRDREHRARPWSSATPPIAMPVRIAIREHGRDEVELELALLLLPVELGAHPPQHVDPVGRQDAAEHRQRLERARARRARGRAARTRTCRAPGTPRRSMIHGRLAQRADQRARRCAPTIARRLSAGRRAVRRSAHGVGRLGPRGRDRRWR